MIPVVESPLDLRVFAQGVGMSTYVTGALLMGQMAHEPYTLEGYIISSGWMFFCFIVGASFTAELASFLSAKEETVLVSHVAAMAHTRTQALPKTSAVSISWRVTRENVVYSCRALLRC